MNGSSGADERPRALVFTPDYPPAHGGIQRLVHNLVRHWDRLEVKVVACSVPGASDFDRGEPIDVHRTWALPGQQPKIAWLNAAGLVAARGFHPDVVLNAHIVTSPAAWGLKRIRRAPFVQYLHGNELVARPHLTRFAVHNAAGTVVVSRHTEELLRDTGATTSTLHIIPPGTDANVSVGTQKCERPTIVTVSRLDQRYKGHDVMIEALDNVRQRIPDVQWIVIGDGELRAEYERTTRDRGLEQAVSFLGSVSDSERDEWLGKAHVFAMPSRLPPDAGGEGFGIAFLEAAAHGLPVVAGDVAGARDAVVDGETGLLVDPADRAAVADAISELLLDRTRAERLGSHGAARAKEFDWPLVSRRVEDLLLSLVTR